MLFLLPEYQTSRQVVVLVTFVAGLSGRNVYCLYVF